MNPSQPTDKLMILMADDDEDDRDLVRDVFHDGQLPGELTFVNDGQELIDYLRGKPPHRGASRPQIILLDLNMPRKDGHEALVEIKADNELCDIPVVVLTTSRNQDDILSSYRQGASSFIAKPTTHTGLIDAMRDLTEYWLNLVELPVP